MMLRLIVAAATVVFPRVACAQHQNRTMNVEVDNDTVQVVRIHLEPRQKLPMHDVTPRVVVWLTEAHIRATLRDGTTREEHGRPGQVDWVPAQRHAAENLDDHAVEFVAIIPKSIEKPEPLRRRLP